MRQHFIYIAYHKTSDIRWEQNLYNMVEDKMYFRLIYNLNEEYLLHFHFYHRALHMIKATYSFKKKIFFLKTTYEEYFQELM